MEEFGALVFHFNLCSDPTSHLLAYELGETMLFFWGIGSIIWKTKLVIFSRRVNTVPDTQ